MMKVKQVSLSMLGNSRDPNTRVSQRGLPGQAIMRSGSYQQASSRRTGLFGMRVRAGGDPPRSGVSGLGLFEIPQLTTGSEDPFAVNVDPQAVTVDPAPRKKVSPLVPILLGVATVGLIFAMR